MYELITFQLMSAYVYIQPQYSTLAVSKGWQLLLWYHMNEKPE